MKWIPKQRFVPPSMTPNVPLVIRPDPPSIAAFSDVVMESSAFPDNSNPILSPTALVSDIEWSTDENAWIHIYSDVRYDHARHDFHMFVSDDVGKSRRLHYAFDGGGLILLVEGSRVAHNRSFLHDDSWDRRFIYCTDYPRFVVDIATHFADYLHVLGPDSNDSSSCWEEEPKLT